jgi:uncharacterized protein YdcH (DUF465 family)
MTTLSVTDGPTPTLAQKMCTRPIAREVTMSANPVLTRDELLYQNEEYRRLTEQHRAYEARLTALVEKAVLSDDEQLEEVTLKKKKLQVKDRMEAIARQTRSAAAQ